MKVLDQVKTQFPETKQFIDGCVEQECLKENISAEQVIFLFTCQKAKSQRNKNIFSFALLSFKADMFSLELSSAKYVKRYSMKINSLGMIITCVLFGFSLKKAFSEIFAHKIDPKIQFCKNVGDRVLYNP